MSQSRFCQNHYRFVGEGLTFWMCAIDMMIYYDTNHDQDQHRSHCWFVGEAWMPALHLFHFVIIVINKVFIIHPLSVLPHVKSHNHPQHRSHYWFVGGAPARWIPALWSKLPVDHQWQRCCSDILCRTKFPYRQHWRVYHISSQGFAPLVTLATNTDGPNNVRLMLPSTQSLRRIPTYYTDIGHQVLHTVCTQI